MTFVDPVPVSAPLVGPCNPWTTVQRVRDQCGTLTPALADDAAVEFGIGLASLVLWAKTGRRLGLCRKTVHPCWDGIRRVHRRADYLSGEPGGARIAYGCGCSIPELLLPGPIAAVESVLYDGLTIPAADLKIKTTGLHAREALLRRDGENWWCCNDLDGDPTVTATGSTSCPAWVVNYWQGIGLDETATTMANILAEQFALARCGANCDQRLSTGLTKVSRRGVVKEYDSSADSDTPTGMPLVDKWIVEVNPHRLVQEPLIFRADDPERHRLWSWVDAA